MPDRTYLDWNAAAPLRPEARAAMIEAMDVVGNPSSVHSEGRAAKMIVEKAREQVAALVGCDTEEVVFTSGATEAVATVFNDQSECFATPVEHDCVWSAVESYSLEESSSPVFEVSSDGVIAFTGYAEPHWFSGGNELFFHQRANSETGVLQCTELPEVAKSIGINGSSVFRDVAQAVGKIVDLGRFTENQPLLHSYLAVSAHKIGGAKGAGALIAGPDYSAGTFEPLIHGGGQEKGRRSGTENVIGIAGFGAAAEASQRDLDAGAWEPIEELRDDLEATLRDCAGDDLTIFGETAARLPNTSCFAIPGWKGETQVMQLDLAGFAVSAGSACSSGKVGPSRVLKAMGFDDITASSAIRVSMGPTTTKDEVSRFIDAWTGLYQKMKTRAA